MWELNMSVTENKKTKYGNQSIIAFFYQHSSIVRHVIGKLHKKLTPSQYANMTCDVNANILSLFTIQ